MKKLPSIKSLLNEAWVTLNPSLLELFKLYIICALLGIAIFAVFGSIGFFSGVSGILGAVTNKLTPETVLRSLNVPVLVFSGLGLFVSMWALGLSMGIALVEIISKKGALTALAALKGARNRIIPLFLMSLLSGFLVFGSMVLFVLPGIFMAILMLFAQIEVILGKQSPVNAIKRSAQLVMDNFGQLFLHWGALILLYFGIQVLVPNILSNAAPRLEGLIALLTSISSVVLGWFMVSYNVLLYKKLSNKDAKPKGMLWMWAMAGLGWVLFFLLMSSIVRFVTSPAFMNVITEGINKNKNMRNEQFMQQYQNQYQKQYQMEMEKYPIKAQ